ncbi:MAG: hypothetical protein HY958_05635 [Bacteroidia bacterium]|nr:hypothetical protein [Bacteroidia bacterium]
MIKANELNEWSKDIFPILTDINTSFNNLRIIKIEDAEKLPEIRHHFFKSLWHQQRFILIVQLAKLLCDDGNQKRNFNKLCNKFENDGLDNEIKNLLEQNSSKLTDVHRTREDILKSVAEIKVNLQKQKNTIEKVKTLRDKVFAHTDPNGKTTNVNHVELEELVLFANEIYNSLFGKIFDRYVFLEKTEKWDLRFIIEIIKDNNQNCPAPNSVSK